MKLCAGVEDRLVGTTPTMQFIKHCVELLANIFQLNRVLAVCLVSFQGIVFIRKQHFQEIKDTGSAVRSSIKYMPHIKPEYSALENRQSN